MQLKTAIRAPKYTAKHSLTKPLPPTAAMQKFERTREVTFWPWRMTTQTLTLREERP